jgi:hypothetical protein
MATHAEFFATDRHAFIENAMEKLGISWREVTVNVNDVDIKDNTYQTRRNVAESCSSVVREYADKMKSGESFPMIVLEEKSSGRYRVVAGRHRASAYAESQNGKTGYKAYVVEKGTSRDALFALSAKENNANGVRQSTSDTAKFAASKLLEAPLPNGSRIHQPMVINRVAEMYAVERKSLGCQYKALLVEREMIRVGVDPSGVLLTALHPLWKWTQTADWGRLAAAVSENASLPGLIKLIHSARKDKVGADVLLGRIHEARDAISGRTARHATLKDPATITVEHLSLAMNDIRGLAPPRNLPEEIADEISSMVEAIRVACKEWKSR